jgi:uncharacterized protein YdeI (BOF family)
MKKVVFLLVIGMLLLSGAVFAQTTQPASSPNQQTRGDEFTRGGYNGPALATFTIADLLNAAPNQWVIVQGYLIQERVPGTYVLADSPTNPTISVIVRLDDYSWSNLTINADTRVLIYGVVNRSELRTEIEGVRVEVYR